MYSQHVFFRLDNFNGRWVRCVHVGVVIVSVGVVVYYIVKTVSLINCFSHSMFVFSE